MLHGGSNGWLRDDCPEHAVFLRSMCDVRELSIINGQFPGDSLRKALQRFQNLEVLRLNYVTIGFYEPDTCWRRVFEFMRDKHLRQFEIDNIGVLQDYSPSRVVRPLELPIRDALFAFIGREVEWTTSLRQIFETHNDVLGRPFYWKFNPEEAA